jgi:hypothetical protein
MNVVPQKRFKLSQIFTKERLFKSTHFKISLGYVIVAVVAITSFVYAKKDINKNRVEIMKIKDEISKTKSSYNERFPQLSAKNAKYEEEQRKKNLIQKE